MKKEPYAIVANGTILVAVALAWSGSLAHDVVAFSAPLPESTFLNLLVYGLLYLLWWQNRHQPRLIFAFWRTTAG